MAYPPEPKPRTADLHCHILPALDDGAIDLDDSVAMARQAAGDGIELVCATPHIRHDHDVRIPELPARVGELNAALEEAGVEVTVLTGGEVAEPVARGLTDAELRAVSLGGGRRWVLLEPAPGPIGDAFLATVDALAARGFRTVVAHPERHFAGEATLAALGRAVSAGALVQVTAQLLADSGPDWAPVRLAEAGLLHLVASDSHSSRFGRPLRLSAGFARLAQLPAAAPHLDWIAREAPRAVVTGADVTAPFEPRP